MSSIAAALVLFSVVAGPAPHDPGLSSVHVRAHGDGLVVQAAFANADFRAACAPGVDADGDGRLDAAELTAAPDALRELARERFVLHTADGAAGAELLAARIAGDDDDVELTLRFAPPTGACRLELRMLALLSRGHRCYAAQLGDGDRIVVDALLAPSTPEFAFDATAGVAATDAGTTGFAQGWRFFALGVEHILIGFDHLAFLLALLIAGPSLRRVAATITAFTVAHSLTLLGAALGVVHAPGALVEATIAASIVVVALANLLPRANAAHRWPLAFAFGLVHGFGFAGVLAELRIGGPDMVVPLLTFNLGVEVGQLAFACAVVPLLARAARHPRGARVATVLSLLVAAAGAWWLVERLLG